MKYFNDQSENQQIRGIPFLLKIIKKAALKRLNLF